MKLLFFILFLFFPSLVYAVPATTVSITPSAVDATTITAADENTRNSAISTWANNHDHNDIDQTANTLAVGDATAGNKNIQANNADTNKPFIRYDDTNDRWVTSRDGTTIEVIAVLTGATNGHFALPQTITSNQLVRFANGRLEGSQAHADNNGDTLIQVEETSGENIIRMDTAGTERWIMTAAGERTMPTQPAFLVTNVGAQTNIATGGVTVVLDSEIFDQSSDFATNTFTAPVSGKYMLSATIAFGNMDQATTYQLRLITSNRTYNIEFDPRQFAADPTSAININFSVLADMDAADTCTLNFYQDGGTQQTDVAAGGAYLSGYLAI